MELTETLQNAMALDQAELTDLRNLYAIAVRDLNAFKGTSVFYNNRSRNILKERTAIIRGPLSIEGDEIWRDVFVILENGTKLRVTDEPMGPWWYVLRLVIEEMQAEYMVYVKSNPVRSASDKKKLHLEDVKLAKEACTLYVIGDESDGPTEEEKPTPTNSPTPSGTKGSVDIQ